MDEPLEEAYFGWLCAKVLTTRPPVYDDLLRILYCTEFVYVHPMDRNRAEDGMEQRRYFLQAAFTKGTDEFLNYPCSVLEMLVAFAERACFQTDQSTIHWFWIFMNNLNLDEYRRVSNADKPVIEEILNVFMWRLYDPYGRGGLFPMRRTHNDQRKVELWYQFFEYLDDQGLM